MGRVSLQGQQVVDHINKKLQSLAKAHPGKNVCIDFDSVLAHWEEGGDIEKIGAPLKPGLDLIRAIRKLGLNPIVLTARPKQQHRQLQDFLHSQGAEAQVTNVKPPALLYIDDKAERYPPNFGAKMEGFEKEAQENGGDGSMNMLDGDRYKSLATHD